MIQLRNNLIALPFFIATACVIYLFLAFGLQLACTPFDIFREKGCLYTLNHTSVNNVAFSPDGSVLATSSYDDTIGLWQVSNGERMQMIPSGIYGTEAMAFSPDGTILAFVTYSSIQMHQVSDGSQLKGLSDGKTILKIAFASNNNLLASGGYYVSLWQLPEGTLLHQFEREGNHNTSYRVNAVAFSPDGTLLAAGSDDSSVRLWRVADKTLLHKLSEDASIVRDVIFAPNGLTLAASIERIIYIWRTSDGMLLHKLEGHTNTVNELSYSPDGTILASAGSEGAMRLWQVSDGTLLRTVNLGRWYGNSVFSVDIAPDGKLLAVGQKYNPVRVFDLQQLLAE